MIRVAGGQSKASHRREIQAQADATQERITLIAIGVLVAVAVLVAAGVVWGVILPPRAHVITVGDRQFNAGAVAERAEFMLRAAPTGQTDPIEDALTMIRRHETLLQAGAADVGEITADDLEKAAWTRMNLPPESSKEEFVAAYQAYLRNNHIDKATLDRMLSAQIVYDRMAKKVQPEVGESGLQLHVQAVASRDQNKMKQFRDAGAGGADFAATAMSMGLVQKPESVDLGWILPPESGYLKDTVKIEGLQAGQLTDVVAREGGLQFEVYRMAERDEKRAYTDGDKVTLSNRKVDAWIAAQADRVKISLDLSDGERKWITDRLTKTARTIAEEQAKAAAVPSTPPIRVTK